MTESPSPRAGSNPAQLKADIDAGRTGDKAGGFDPAAAPLGTDEEAGGAPPSPAEVERARQVERKPGGSTARSNAAASELTPSGWSNNRTSAALGLAAGAVVATLLGALLVLALGDGV